MHVQVRLFRRSVRLLRDNFRVYYLIGPQNYDHLEIQEAESLNTIQPSNHFPTAPLLTIFYWSAIIMQFMGVRSN